MAPSSRLRSASATKRKGSIGGSAKAASTSAKQGKSSAEKRAATIAAKKAKDSEVEPEDDAGEESSEDDKENSEKDSGGDDGTDGSSSTGSDISEDTKEELLKLITARKAAKKRKVSPTSAAVVTAAAAKVSVDKADQRARRNDASVAEEKRKRSQVKLGKIIASLGSGTVARTASPQDSGVTKTRDDSAANKPERKAALPSDDDDEENHDVVELPAVPVKTRRIRRSVDMLISWLSKSTFTLLPTPLPAFTLAEGHLSLVYTASLLTVAARFPPGAQHTYETYLGLLDVVQRSLPQLFTGSADKLPIANLHVFEIMTMVKAQLDQAFRNLEGQQVLIDLTFSAFVAQLCADGHAFDPVAAVIKLMTALSHAVVAKKTKKSINDSCSGPRGSSAVVQHQHLQQRQQQQQIARAGVPSSHGAQPPLGLGLAHTSTPFPPMVGLAGQAMNDKFRRWIRYPRDPNGSVMMTACMLCGQGSTPGSVGHRADACGATAQQQEEWINHALPVK